jgi:hypothetical protein
MDIKDAFVGKARKYNNYQECECTEGRKCIKCTHWRLSYPYTCEDYDMYSDKAETCLNWTDDIHCKVD